MKFTITFVAALLTTAAAQGLGDLPDCSKSCATGSIPQNCGIDFKCVCESKSFLADVACCIADKCSKADQDTEHVQWADTLFFATATIKVAKSICVRGGVTDLPAEVICSSSKSSSSSGTSTSSSSNSTETGTKSSTETSGATKTSDSTTVTGTKASTTTSNSASSSVSSASAAATSTGVAAFTHKDTSLLAAAGAAAAFAVLI
ncbi:hypothetical protein LT330_002047 [Penicillium expansum]|nr:hypothetical protein LT330_002047 [Penicillium expansum]